MPCVGLCLMGASFLWEPMSAERGHVLGVDARSHVAEVLDRLFGSEPWILSAGEWLRALQASEPEESAWQELEYILIPGLEIKVWRQW